MNLPMHFDLINLIVIFDWQIGNVGINLKLFYRWTKHLGFTTGHLAFLESEPQGQPRFWYLYSYILLALFGTNNQTPPTVLALGAWNFQRSLPMVWGWSAREDFLIPPQQPTPCSKRCLQIRSGGPSAYFKASFSKYKLFEIVQGVINFQYFLTY